MSYLKNFTKSLLFFLISIITIPILLTIFNLCKIETNKIIIIIFGSIIMFITGFILGNKIKSKAYLYGLLLSIITIIILLFLSLIFSYNININTLIYYIILCINTIFGSILGINKDN